MESGKRLARYSAWELEKTYQHFFITALRSYEGFITEWFTDKKKSTVNNSHPLHNLADNTYE
jgi:hypothetical protein